jgi:hypothetical protein
VSGVVSDDLLAILLLNLIGSVCGAFLALIIRMPKTRRGFRERAGFSIAAGMTLSPITAPILRKFFDVAQDGETRVALATVTAFASWWCGRRFLRLVEDWGFKAKSADE